MAVLPTGCPPAATDGCGKKQVFAPHQPIFGLTGGAVGTGQADPQKLITSIITSGTGPHPFIVQLQPAPKQRTARNQPAGAPTARSQAPANVQINIHPQGSARALALARIIARAAARPQPTQRRRACEEAGGHKRLQLRNRPGRSFIPAKTTDPARVPRRQDRQRWSPRPAPGPSFRTPDSIRRPNGFDRARFGTVPASLRIEHVSTICQPPRGPAITDRLRDMAPINRITRYAAPLATALHRRAART